MTAPERDEFSGQATTGHDWDGIKELDNPLPRWWLMVFYASIVWGIGYWVVYPAWPLISGYTEGVINYSSRAEVAAEIAAADEAKRAYTDRIAASDLATIRNDQELMAFALAGGKSAYGDNCAGCHGSAAQGGKGYPNLSDDDWLWGGSLEAIQQTIQYGIRSAHDDTRDSEMPAFGRDEILSRDQIAQVSEYVLSLSGKAANAERAKLGAPIYAEQCIDCHGDKGQGNREFGAPNLADAIWLFGSDAASVRNIVANSRKAVMPHWEGRLPAATIKQLAIFIHSLGGGE
ncbi:MAG: cytochrome-c oxidase, cbb3-type subunit III [Rhodospirillaceae bacterium]|nr:cytochrome-c oxidase, cbb3-type subunit III [Rhodospirillaceae bacterium]MDD9928309.1 cytochrome-c oxidase, cbb3-type subunit III [Rhodospirillaceae bacterium]